MTTRSIFLFGVSAVAIAAVAASAQTVTSTATPQWGTTSQVQPQVQTTTPQWGTTQTTTTSAQLQSGSVRSPTQLSTVAQVALPTCWMTITMPDGTTTRVSCIAVAHYFTPYPGTNANGWDVEVSGGNQQWPVIKLTTDAMFGALGPVSVPHAPPGMGPHGAAAGYQAHYAVTYGSTPLACGSQYVNVTAIGSQKSSNNGETDYAINGNGGVLCTIGGGSAQINIAF